ncbi:MAG TPA: DNA repair protein RecN [Acidimicrobiales bacterium]|nr:DNA repair protein RecN [Acidimicrobiales bacterium]
MLAELRVRDLGVISELSLVLGPGMTALTGETGAGKTLVVEAIELLTGGRADPVLVRPGAGEAVVEGRFVTGEDELVISRVVPAEGRSRAYIDGRMATLSALAEATESLVDLHGQHAHQSLLRTAGQRAALDAFAGVDLAPLRAARSRLAAVERSLSELGGDARARAREIDLLRFQLEEIDSAALAEPDEDETLSAEEDLLSQAAATREAVMAAHEWLSGEEGAGDRLASALAAVSGRPAADATEKRLRAVAAEVSDLAGELRGLAESVVEDPERLDAVRHRRQLLRDLRRKYGETLAEVISFAEQTRRRLEELTGVDEAGARLEAEREAAAAEVAAEARRVAQARRGAAATLAGRVQRHLVDLAMGGARVEIVVDGEDPADDVSFLLAANPGSPPLPLAKVASGGELARAMLAARLVLSQGPPVLVFDEVDAGVGGEAAVAVGRALASLAHEHQVLVVTHLPQVAAFADHQVAVSKAVADGRTTTAADRLDDAGRVIELSRMLAGRPDSSRARDHARELLTAAAKERAR